MCAVACQGSRLLYQLADFGCVTTFEIHRKVRVQVSDSYVGLDQTFWLDTYTMKQAAQPLDSNRDAVGDVRDGQKGQRRNHLKGQDTGE